MRAQFVNTKEIPFNSVSIVTERGIVYLMGFVTEKEGEIAAHVASRVTGVQQVVKVFDYGTPEEVQRRRGVSSQPPRRRPRDVARATGRPRPERPGDGCRCRILASAEMRRVPFVNRALSVGTFVL